MKKMAWIALVIVVLGAGLFWYVTQNPQQGLSQKVLQATGPRYAVPHVNPTDVPENCVKYFDGCNECTVQSGGILTGCGPKQCETLTGASCKLFKMDPNQKIPMDICAKYFDGCNFCDVKNGKPVNCTKKFCKVKEIPYCKEYRPVPKLDLTNCATFFDGCNTCKVESGAIMGCTRMFCDAPQMSQCVEHNNLIADCTTYFDGCNTCDIVDGKPVNCTKKFCEKLEASKCINHDKAILNQTGVKK